jgi:hypothetical protein
MAGQAGMVREIQAFEDASDNHPVTVRAAPIPTVATVAGFPASEAVGGAARSLQQPSAAINP